MNDTQLRNFRLRRMHEKGCPVRNKLRDRLVYTTLLSVVEGLRALRAGRADRDATPAELAAYDDAIGLVWDVAQRMRTLTTTAHDRLCQRNSDSARTHGAAVTRADSLVTTDEQTDDVCSCCGGDLPAPRGRRLDALDRYLVRADGMCPGTLRTDGAGRVVGCGAWSAKAYAAVRP